MKYAVIGLGAVGSIVGGLLSKQNENVVLIGKENQIKTIQKDGLKIHKSDSEIIVKNIDLSSNSREVFYK